MDIDSSVLYLLPAGAPPPTPPSVFEVALQRKLGLALQPAFHYMCSHVCDRTPDVPDAPDTHIHFQLPRSLLSLAATLTCWSVRLCSFPQLLRGQAAGLTDELFMVVSLLLNRRSLTNSGRSRVYVGDDSPLDSPTQLPRLAFLSRAASRLCASGLRPRRGLPVRVSVWLASGQCSGTTDHEARGWWRSVAQ
jgi:hypothetical protein